MGLGMWGPGNSNKDSGKGSLEPFTCCSCRRWGNKLINIPPRSEDAFKRSFPTLCEIF